MSTILWLDDIREPWKHGYGGSTWVKTADEAITALKTGRFTFASLDHDLSVEATMGTPAPDERTGYTVILFLEEFPEYWPVDGVRVHSLKTSGKLKMQAAIHRYYGRNFQ